MSYYVYILASRSRNLYVGVTNNLLRRMSEHRDGLVKFTSRYRTTRLVHVEEAARPMDAIAREKQIKAWTRAKRLALIESENPAWDDMLPPPSGADPSLRSG